MRSARSRAAWQALPATKPHLPPPCLCRAGYILLCTLFLALPFATRYPKAWLNRKTRLAQ